jgi:hypothetical protein
MKYQKLFADKDEACNALYFRYLKWGIHISIEKVMTASCFSTGTVSTTATNLILTGSCLWTERFMSP